MALKGLMNSTHTIVFGHYGGGSLEGEKAYDCGGPATAQNRKQAQQNCGFQMPLHYPRYKKKDYDKIEEWKLDLLLHQYGLSYQGTLQEKREFAIGAFVWPAPENLIAVD